MDNTALPSTPSPVTDSELAAHELRSEVQDYLFTREQRRRLFPRALLVGVASGALAVLFRLALSGGDNLRNQLLLLAHHYPAFGWLLPMVFGAVCAGLSVALVRRFAPEASGSGIPHLEAVLRRFRNLDGKRVLPVKFLGGVLALGSGLAMGREGPTIQMGASIADILSHKLRVSPKERRILLAAGAGAGLAAAFNAPLAGLVFVLEEIQRDFRPIVFGTAFLAAAAANVFARSTSGQLPVFQVPSYPVPTLAALPIFALLGCVAGVLGVAFNRGLLGTIKIFSGIQKRLGKYAWIPAAAMGAVVGIVGWFAPMALGGGHGLAETAMAGRIALAMIPLWFLLRYVLTLTSYATGAPGGVFAPMLGLGALIGLGLGDLSHQYLPGIVPHAEIFAVVGMAAYFTAIVRAPLTGIVLIVEMTGNYEQMLPLIVACFCAYTVAESLKDLPIYEALLERDLAKGPHAESHHPDQALIQEWTIQPGSPFDGKRVRNLGLPQGCILVSGRDETGEWIPAAATRLKAEDRITAVISQDAAPQALEILRTGCAFHGQEVAYAK